MRRTKYFTYTLLLILFSSLCLGCASQEPEAEVAEETEEEAGAELPEETQEEMPAGEEEVAGEALSGEAIYTNVTEENNYKNWDLFPGTQEFAISKGVHGPMVTIYVSDKALSAIEESAEVMPNGSIIVKDNYNENKELSAVTLMQKVDGFDPENNDWYWLVFDAEGNITAEGKVDSCSDCHSRAEKDHLFSWVQE